MCKQNTQVCKILGINKEQQKGLTIEKHSSETIYLIYPTAAL